MAGFCILFLTCCFSGLLSPVISVKLKFAPSDDCDRHSLEALYYEKYKIITEDVFTDSNEFVSRVMELTSDSILAIVAKLPGREVSNKEDLLVFKKFDDLKRRFLREMRHMKRNITTAWESLLAVNMDLLLDRENSSLDLLQKSTDVVADNYKKVRDALHSSMRIVLSPVKTVVRDGLKSITHLAKSELLKKQNVSNTDNETDVEKATADEHIDEEEMKKTVTNITSLIVPEFLGKVTLDIYEKQIDLAKEIKSDEDKDSPLDEVYFDILLMQKRINSLVDTDYRKNKETRDLARRNIYMYWSDSASSMYEEKMKGASYAATSIDRIEKYKSLWKNEQDLGLVLRH